MWLLLCRRGRRRQTAMLDCLPSISEVKYLAMKEIPQLFLLVAINGCHIWVSFDEVLARTILKC